MSMSPESAIAQIASRVSAETGLPVKEIMGKRRTAPVAAARAAVMFEARQLGFSYPLIGRLVKRDHTTAVHAVKSEAKRRGCTELFRFKFHQTRCTFATRAAQYLLEKYPQNQLFCPMRYNPCFLFCIVQVVFLYVQRSYLGVPTKTELARKQPNPCGNGQHPGRKKVATPFFLI